MAGNRLLSHIRAYIYEGGAVQSGGSNVLIRWTLLRLNLSEVNGARVREASRVQA